MIPIVPAIIPTSAEHLKAVLPSLSFSPEIHVDVVDGVFVPYQSWPYDPPGTPKEVQAYTDRFTLEVDLMVAEPLIAAEAWVAAGADMLVFHTEHISPAALARFVEGTRVSVGIAAINDTELSDLAPYLAVADYVQLMGIAKVGAQGQPFDERVLERIAALKLQYPRLSITIDGSVNAKTIKRLVAAGADRFICGSAIVGADNPYEAHQALQALIK
jgi:ribulose-phosphate 3-epimerase